MSLVDRALTALLFLSAIFQALGALRVYGADAEALLMALPAATFLALLAAVNWLRAARPGDRLLATITFVFGLLACLFVIADALAIRRFFDVRILGHLILTLGLLWFSARALARR